MVTRAEGGEATGLEFSFPKVDISLLTIPAEATNFFLLIAAAISSLDVSHNPIIAIGGQSRWCCEQQDSCVVCQTRGLDRPKQAIFVMRCGKVKVRNKLKL